MSSPPSAERRPGRPSLQQTEARTSLLDAGLRCVVEHGAAAVTVKQVALDAGVTPASLHYHFGDKQGLLQALVDQRLVPALSTLRAALSGDDNQPAAQIRAFVDAVFVMVEQHPWLPRLWLREVLSEGGALREVMLSRVAPSIPRALAERFASAQAAGRLNTALDPRLLVVSLIGLTLFPLAAEPLWGQIFSPAAPDRARLRQHTLALIEAAFTPSASTSHD
ncbi:TetR/AcrR family transcriptional regulator [Pseudomarimonas arenosa]|uniref:TetR/AcrR family transcriptional regulator n=1 Tax=Pseudomarimonas arenosa TaxID=2774145 RepID=A0AAW3ZGV1_9GAMM|nr:TetR/AcrR family transcriptional regulator [Pseudomarimonas arenosa]MBD8525253.1 TetR/AcrR family transcriptional regulator [Pseudomarimonas arenosa]